MYRLSSDDWHALLEIARRAISCVILDGQIPNLPPYPASLSEPTGAFVTLYRGGALCGCVGQLENPGPLADVVARAAISAALYDPRFPALRAEELSALKIEISVLTRPEPIQPESIIAGRHGLLVMNGSLRGVLLPQVAPERSWNGRRLLEETCIKAGLAPDAWRHPATQVFGFTAEAFSESETPAIPGS
ncbi:MAG TPA: AmmeMemoRadiSam system protein A [Candidatus Acidoferrales bacterium]|nr:AmmeMemoRadiSam system protein A [Candidatus Acidoferrales bacterium]